MCRPRRNCLLKICYYRIHIVKLLSDSDNYRPRPTINTVNKFRIGTHVHVLATISLLSSFVSNPI